MYRVPGFPRTYFLFRKINFFLCIFSSSILYGMVFFLWGHSLSIFPTFRYFIIPMEPLRCLLRVVGGDFFIALFYFIFHCTVAYSNMISLINLNKLLTFFLINKKKMHFYVIFTISFFFSSEVLLRTYR